MRAKTASSCAWEARRSESSATRRLARPTSAGDVDARQVVVATGNQNTSRTSRNFRERTGSPETAALVGIPQPSTLSGQEGAGGGLRVVGNGDRARPCDGRGGEGLAGRAHATEHPAAVASRRSARRSDLTTALSLPGPDRRRDRPGSTPQEPRRPQGVRPADSRRGRVGPRELRAGACAGRHGGHRRDQGWVHRVVADRRVLRRRHGVLVDGSRLEPHAVVLATGYRTGLEPLVGHLGVLDEGANRSCGANGPPRRARVPRLHVRPS